MRTLWVDNRLTTACRYGHTLVYDEFTRSRPEANNVLLSVLGEEFLNLPNAPCRRGLPEGGPGLPGHLHFQPRGIRRVHKSQDALMDRLITIHVEHTTARRRWPSPPPRRLSASRPARLWTWSAATANIRRPAPAEPAGGDHDRPRRRSQGRNVRRRRPHL